MQFSNAITFVIVTLAASASAAAVNPNLVGSGANLEARKPTPADVLVERSEIIPTRSYAALDPRQSQTVDSKHADKESAQNALDDKRAEGRRKLSGTTANCKSSACHTCMNAATTASLAEVVGCGIIAAGTEVGTGGAGTGFVVAGFAACETAIVGNMEKSVVECESLT